MALPGVGIAAWGLVTGVALVKGGMTVTMALVLTVTVFAGSAQLAVLPLLHAHNPLLVVWATALLVNVRFTIFAAASRKYFTKMTLPQRFVAGYLNGDLGFAMFMQRVGSADVVGTKEQWGYFYGGAAVNWVVWQVSSIAGIFLGGLAPTSWGLELAATLALVTVLIPMATRFPSIVGLIVSGVLAVALNSLPLRLGLLVAVLGGVSVALVAETSRDRRLARHSRLGSTGSVVSI